MSYQANSYSNNELTSFNNQTNTSRIWIGLFIVIIAVIVISLFFYFPLNSSETIDREEPYVVYTRLKNTVDNVVV